MPGRHRDFGAVREHQYGVLRTAFGISLVGNSVGGVAYPLFVLDAVGDIAFTGAVVTVSIVASVLTGVLMGPLLDRWGLHRSWLGSALIGAGANASTLVLYLTDALPAWLLLFLAFVRAGADEPGRVATFGLLPAVAGESGRTLERANATLRGMNALASLLGPILAGVVVGFLGSPVTVLLEAVAGGLTAVILGLLLAAPTATAESRATNGQSYYEHLRVALRFFWYDRLLRVLVISTMVFAALDTGLASIGLTMYAEEELGSAAWYGGLVSFFGAGSLAGTIAYGVMGHRMPRRGVYLGAYLSFAMVVLTLAVVTSVPIALAAMFVAGLVISPVDLLYMLVLQERVPERVFGGVASLATTVVSAPSPLAVALLTWMISANGSRRTFLVLGCCYLGVAFGLFFIRPLYGLRSVSLSSPGDTSRSSAGSDQSGAEVTKEAPCRRMSSL
ncbi:MFS transporter [Frankia sp. AgB32]|uniref:MFS transporter n=1 Tax=Frankia sp. AgB32 TaxID=631119 RepID=UPI00200E0072|nr:MFS transporter [Frankia sp. AgB32]MCK9894581.1 MFS transporter [Frankia sp. AgB32]